MLAPKKKIVRMTGSNNWSDVMINNWCTLQWSLEEKNISNSLESFQKLQFLNIHFINFNFVLRNYFFSLFSRSILLTGNTIAMKGTYIPYRICQINCGCHGEVYLIQHYVIKLVCDLRHLCVFFWVLHQYNWPPLYNWNIVESGVKHHNPKPNKLIIKNKESEMHRSKYSPLRE